MHAHLPCTLISIRRGHAHTHRPSTLIGHAHSLATADGASRQANWTTYAYCRAHGIRISGYRPLGAFAKWSEPPLPAVARAHNKSVAQILLRWALQKGVVPIFGSDSERHVRADVDIFDFTLTADELDGVTNMGLRETGLCRFWDGAVARMAPCRNDDVQR
jgi:diketogulonate reductase-like aldo/keto reductase